MLCSYLYPGKRCWEHVVVLPELENDLVVPPRKLREELEGRTVRELQARRSPKVSYLSAACGGVVAFGRLQVFFLPLEPLLLVEFLRARFCSSRDADSSKATMSAGR